MKKIITIISLITIILSINTKALDIDSKNILLYNLTDDIIIYEKNSEENTSIASITKLMTIIISIEKINDLNDTVTITSEMLKDLDKLEASIANFKVGETYTYKDLLYIGMLRSAAECMRALAITLTGSEENFVVLMNEKAREIGMKNTTFTNTTGLDTEGQRSTLKDVLIMLKYCLKNDLFKDIYTKKSYYASNYLTYRNIVLDMADLVNTDISFISGFKSGYTDDAGKCLTSLTIDSEDDKELILITTKASTLGYNHIKDTANILNYYIPLYSNKKIYNKNDTIYKLPIKYSNQFEYEIKINKDLEYYIDNIDQEKIKIEFDGIKEISYNNKIGDSLGKIKIYYDNNLIDESEYKIETKIKLSILGLILLYKIPIIIIILIITSLIIIKIKQNKKRI